MGSSEGPMKVTSKYMKWLEEGGRDQCYALVERERFDAWITKRMERS